MTKKSNNVMLLYQLPFVIYSKPVNPRAMISSEKRSKGRGYFLRKLLSATTGLIIHGKRIRLPKQVISVWERPVLL